VLNNRIYKKNKEMETEVMDGVLLSSKYLLKINKILKIFFGNQLL